MNTRKKKIFSISFLAFIVAVMLLTAGIFFSFSLRNILLGQQKIYILEAAEHASAEFTGYLQREMQTLKALSEVFNNFYSYSSLEEYLNILEDIGQYYSFNNIGLFFTDTGNAYFDNGEMTANFLPKEILDKVLEGQSVVSNLIEDPFTKQSVIIYATPFIVNGKTEAVLFAIQTLEELQKILLAHKISGEGFVVIVNKKDQVIMDTETDSPRVNKNLKELLALTGENGVNLYNDLISVLNEKKEGVLGYTISSSKEHRFLSFVRISILGLEDWHLIFVIPSKVVSVLQKRIFLGSLVFCFALLISFAVILVFIERKEQEQREELFDIAFKDNVTGAYNLARFHRELEHILKTNRDRKYALILLDIENFKLINDLYGFRQGDLVLNHLANVLEENTDKKKGEIFCRAIGDIFVMLVTYNNEAEIIERMNKIYKAVQSCYAVTDMHYTISTCFGVYKIKDNLPFFLMLDRASLAKKTAKTSANKRYVFYDDNSFKNVLQNKEIENSVQQAMKDDEFKLYFQPKCAFDKNNICSAEVLVRWQNPKHGIILPDQFIPIFEHNGFIIKLDFYMLERTLQVLRSWIDAGLKPCKLSINFSRLHLKDELSLPKIKILLDFYKVPAELIEFEITESAVMSNSTDAKKFIDGLHSMGISVAMDDFGSGYSSLNVLKDLPFDTLKIDKEFLKDFGTNPRTSAVLEGVITMLKDMNTCIVAEGVETEDQAKFLTSLKCDMAQGFLYYKPLQEEEFKNILGSKESENKDGEP